MTLSRCLGRRLLWVFMRAVAPLSLSRKKSFWPLSPLLSGKMQKMWRSLISLDHLLTKWVWLLAILHLVNACYAVRFVSSTQANLPLLQRELLHCARAAKQTPAQYLSQHEHLLLSTTVPSPADSSELLLEPNDSSKRHSPNRYEHMHTCSCICLFTCHDVYISTSKLPWYYCDMN